MTKRTGRGYAVRAEKSGPITFLASTDALVKQDGLSIERGAWRFDRYRMNPIVLFGHDLAGQRLPIGRATKYAEDSRGLIVDVEFDQGDDFAREVERKLRQGYLNGVSISWDTLRREGSTVKVAELIEVSVVPVPADANAVAIARSAYRGSSNGDWWSKPYTGTYTKAKRRFKPNELRIIDMLVTSPKATRDKILRDMSDAELKVVDGLLRDFDQAGLDGTIQLRMARGIRGAILDYAKGRRR